MAGVAGQPHQAEDHGQQAESGDRRRQAQLRLASGERCEHRYPGCRPGWQRGRGRGSDDAQGQGEHQVEGVHHQAVDVVVDEVVEVGGHQCGGSEAQRGPQQPADQPTGGPLQQHDLPQPTGWDARGAEQAQHPEVPPGGHGERRGCDDRHRRQGYTAEDVDQGQLLPDSRVAGVEPQLLEDLA
jgi:hypothetical protein